MSGSQDTSATPAGPSPMGAVTVIDCLSSIAAGGYDYSSSSRARPWSSVEQLQHRRGKVHEYVCSSRVSYINYLLISQLTVAVSVRVGAHSKLYAIIRSSEPQASFLSPVQLFCTEAVHSAIGLALSRAVAVESVVALPHAHRSVADLCFAPRDASWIPASVALVQRPTHSFPVQFVQTKEHAAAQLSSDSQSPALPTPRCMRMKAVFDDPCACQLTDPIVSSQWRSFACVEGSQVMVAMSQFRTARQVVAQGLQ
jgi:hypothetical protein